MTAFRVPVATYRIQFNLGFRFLDARDLIPYLHDLGISDPYGSPRFKARRGSSHGYDVADPLRVNSELGTEREYEELGEKRRNYGMGMLLDIVPNHMSASSDNPWWLDVLENGPSSAYASYFDIDWHPATTKAAYLQENKVIIPILGDLYGNVLESGEFALKFDETGFFVRYCDTKLPLDPKTYCPILEDCLGHLTAAADRDHPACRELAVAIKEVSNLPERTAAEPRRIARRQKAKEALKARLWRLYRTSPETKACLDNTLSVFNGTKGIPESFDRLDQLLAEQAYRVAFWKLAAEEINYRRFFDISDLVGLRVEDPRVFEARHALIFQLIREGKLTGLRIDHIDGLHDPLEYLQRLQSSVASTPRDPSEGSNFYVVVEKILAKDEALPEAWPVCGTTGYDFLNLLNGLFVDPEGLRALGEIYRRFTGLDADFAEFSYRGNKLVLQELFTGEVNSLAHELGKLAAQDRHARDIPLSEYVQALIEVTACLPVYRTYLRSFEVSAQDRRYIERALQEAQRRTPEERAGPPAFTFLRSVLLLEPPDYAQDRKEEWLRFVMRWQQFTSSAMAKGLEDTALYTYHRLTSLNEVGGNPGGPGTSLGEFHQALQARQERMPGTLNATSTHDTKRSEDVRARINVLSELPQEWEKHLERWSKWNASKKQVVNGEPAPDRNEEVLLYQTLLGAWPLHRDEVACFRERFDQYVVKAVREAKAHTSWLRPNPEYEDAILSFSRAILEESASNKFLKDLLAFERTIASYGALNSLSQLVLKVASPGVPGFYQGTELWDFSLVDPDNRRPVDFNLRVRLLDDLRRQEAAGLGRLVGDLLPRWEDGRVKLYTTYRALNFRRANAGLFLQGEYVPLEARGRRNQHVCAFARRQGAAWALAAVPRLLTKLVAPGHFPLGKKVWGTTDLVLPKHAPKHWHNVFTGESVAATTQRNKRVLALQQVFHSFPVALLADKSLRPFH
jgi:(1->4)-alpha-D-glucan 1-alpha-D-glucosylmutase